MSYGGQADAAAANTGAARADYMKNKHHNTYQSQAKNLLYGGDDSSAAPMHHGKRSVPHPGQHNAAPFAQWDGAQLGLQDAAVQGGQVTKSYQARNAKKEGAGKIGSTDHGVDAYKAQLVANASNLATQKHKARGSVGLLGQQQQQPSAPQYPQGGQQQYAGEEQYENEPMQEAENHYRY